MARQMDYTPPAVPPPPPAIHREYGEVGGLTRSPYMASNEIVAQMPEFLRQFFRNTRIERPTERDFLRRTPPGFAESRPGQWLAGYYDAPTDTVAVRRGAEDAGDVVGIARHELLHRLASKHPRYAIDGRGAYPQLLSALFNSDRSMWERSRQDPGHAFTGLAETAMTTPDALPLPVQNYFAPLLPPVQTRRGPF